MFKKSVSTLTMSVAALALAVTTASAETTLRVQTSTQSGGFLFQYLEANWVPKLNEMTKGEVGIQMLPINSVMPRNETADGVALGVLDGDLTAVSYFTGRNPAYAILGDLIAGYDSPDQVLKFCRDGGGAEALQALWDNTLPGKIQVIGCSAASKEALVAKVPIRGVADLEGVKIRSPEGLAATVFRKAGASPANIPFSEIFTALEKGVVDAADASAYSDNDRNGFHQIAKFPLYPGIHSMAVHQFTMNKAKWDSFPPETQSAIRDWFYSAYADLQTAIIDNDLKVVEADKAKGDVEVIDWPQADRDKFREIAVGAWEETAAKSPEARAALDAHLAFMKSEGLLK